MVAISNEQRRWRLGQRHYLASPASSIDDVARTLNGLHSSDPVTVYLSGWARVIGFTRDDLDNSLYEKRTLLRMHGMRRTMFVVPPDLAGVMTAACTDTYVATERKRLVGFLEDAGLAEDAAAWLERVEAATVAALDELGQATANELRDVVPELQLKIPFGQGKKWGGEVGVSTRVLFLLATAGQILRTKPLGTWISSQYRWDLLNRWYPPGLDRMDPAAARIDLVERWLRAFGPGTLEDVKWWTGWGIGVTRQAISSCGAVQVVTETGPAFVLPEDQGEVQQPADWVALLPSLDPTVMGWKSRDWYLGEYGGDLFDRNGNAGPTVWHNGRIVGGWAQNTDGEIRIELQEAVDSEAASQIDAAADRLRTWLGDTRITPRFRTPVEKRLLA